MQYCVVAASLEGSKKHIRLTCACCARAAATKAKAELQLEEATMVAKAIDKALSAVADHEQQAAKARQDAADAIAEAERSKQEEAAQKRQQQEAAEAAERKVSRPDLRCCRESCLSAAEIQVRIGTLMRSTIPSCMTGGL